MALLNIVWIPTPVLTTKTQKVENIDDELQKLIDDMFETMYYSRGVGLAANQVGVSKALTVIDVSEEKNQPLVLINPEIIESNEKVLMSEGCLSVPNHFDKVTRATKLRFRALDRHGKPYEMDAEGLLAQCVQHELDHLNGLVYIHYLSPFKQERITEKIKKFKTKNENK